MSLSDIATLNIVDTWVSTLLYGMNVIVYCICVYVLLRRRRGWRAHRILLATTTFTFIITTFHVGFSLEELVKGLILEPKHNPTNPGEATFAYFSNLADPLDVAKITLYGVNTWVADLVLIWRMHVVCGGNWWLSSPALIVEAAYAGCYMTLIVHLSRLPPRQSPASPFLANWAISAWSIHLLVNISVTSLIAYQIYNMRKVFHAAGLRSHPKSTGTLMTIVESGAVYSVTTLLLVALGIARSIACFAIIGALTQFAALSPSLIVVRVGLGLACTSTTQDMASLKMEATLPGSLLPVTLSRATSLNNVPADENDLDYIESQTTRLVVSKEEWTALHTVTTSNTIPADDHESHDIESQAARLVVAEEGEWV